MADKKKTMINSVPAEPFPFRNESLRDMDAPFYNKTALYYNLRIFYCILCFDVKSFNLTTIRL